MSTAETEIKCFRCFDTHVFIQTLSNNRYAQAIVCECFPNPCKTCLGSRFILEKDHYYREVAIPCPDCEELKRHIQLYNSARIPKKFAHSRMAGNDVDADNQEVFMLLHFILKNLKPATSQITESESSDDLKGMVLMGPPGTGKTHLMTGFAYRCAIDLGISCVFQGFAELLSELKQGYSSGKSDIEIIEPHLQSDVLIIDDLGKGRNTDWELSILDTLISERYNRNQIIMVTSNYTESEETTLKERILKKDKTEQDQFTADTIRRRVGSRIYSRLKEMCYFEHLLGKDRRIKDEIKGED